MLSHLKLTQTIAQDAEGEDERARLAAVGSEVASLAGWLHWDMGDNGSARTWYGSSIKAARRAGNPLLAAYQLGSLAQFEAHSGNAAQGLSLTRSARKQLGPNSWMPPTSARKKGGEATGPSPVDRGKTGSKHHLICDGKGTPFKVITTAGNGPPSGLA